MGQIVDPFKELRESYERHSLRLAREFLAPIEALPDPIPIYEELDWEANDAVMEQVLASLLADL